MSYKPYLNQEYEQLKAQSIRSRKLFVDDKFPPNDSSISKLEKGKKDYKVIWKRPHEIISNPQFIVNGIDPNDLAQGDTGDCWLISAASSLAFIPEYFKRVIPSEQSFDYNYAGIFHFRFWQFGEWIDVVVDDYLPTNEEGELIYCHNKIDKNEFFGPLLEKAFAKLFGCYEFLDGGSPSSAMTDFTGAICENFNLVECAKLTYGDDDDEDEDDDDEDDYDDEDDDEDDDEYDEDDYEDDYEDEEDENSEDDEENDNEKSNDNATDLDRLWTFITKSLKMNSMMNVSFYDPEQKGSVEELKENGLYSGHAYSLLQAVEVKYKAKNKKDKKVSLLKLRNPHGCEKPWNGQWSINSKSWKNLDKKTKQKYKLNLDNYGEFFMSFEDFISNFQELNVAHVNPDAYFDPDEEDDEEEFSKGNKEWKEVRFFGEWLPGKNAGANECFWNNAQYLIKVNKSKDISPVVISLMQPYDIKMKMNGKDYEAIKISVYQVESSEGAIKKKISSKTRFNEDELTLFDSTGIYFGDREIARRFNLDAGYYVAIVSNLEVNFRGKFLLRFFHDKNSATITEFKN